MTASRFSRRGRWVLAGAALLIAVGALIVGAGRLDVWALLSARWAEVAAFVAQNPVAAGALYMALYAAATLLLLPGVLWLTIAAGAAFGAPAAAGLTWAAAIGGATSVFLIARTAASGWIARRAGGWVALLRAGFQRDAFKYLLSLRLLPFAPYFAVNLAPAVLGVPLRTFVAASAIGFLPGTILYATIGAGLSTALSSGAAPDLGLAARPEVALAFLAAAALVLTPLAIRFWPAQAPRIRRAISAMASTLHNRWAARPRAPLAGRGALGPPRTPPIVPPSLSSRLLALTAAFVLAGDLLVLAPSLAAYQRGWLTERVTKAQIAVVALGAAEEADASKSLQASLARQAGVLEASLHGPEGEVLRQGSAPLAPAPERRIDLRNRTLGGDLRSALATLFSAEDGRRIVAVDTPRFTAGERLEVAMWEADLARDLRRHALGVMFNSLFVGLVAGALVYATLIIAFVRPMAALTRQILLFRERPQDASIALRPSGRDDEIGRAEQALAEMQEQVRASLRQRERLAGLGAAVAKISHDMRASLATAQLLSERLAASADPKVRQIGPRLERAIERAGALASAALKFGKADEPTPQLQAVGAREALDEAAEEALAGLGGVVWRNAAPADLRVSADADQLHRVFANLIRNAGQAIARQSARAAPGSIAATATRVGDRVLVRIVDDGPGLPEKAKARLFEPFASSGVEGAGLGLAIARELSEAQGGALRLVASSPEGVAFEVELAAAV